MMSQDEVSEQVDAVQMSQGQILNITLLASKWKSSAGGLSTLKRELAIHLAQIQNVRVSLLVPEGACNDEDKREARSFGISILDAKKCVGVEPVLSLSSPPEDHKMDVIVGHGVKLGCQVQLIKRNAQFQNCKWVHVVHTAPEDLSICKDYGSPISRGEKKHWGEIGLCKGADLVVPVGPKLGKAYHSYLQECKKKEDFFELIPGLFESEFGDLPAKQNPKDEKDDFIVLLRGHGGEEDFEVQGYNIAVKAFTDKRLKGKHYFLLFVGSPEGKQDEVRQRLLKYGITDEQLIVREFVKRREMMKHLLCEVDMVIMPSKSEGFGLVALEALSAGLPILVGRNSGFARAIEDIPLGLYSIVHSEDPAKWAEAIQGVRDRCKVVLEENKILKKHYSKKYCWEKQCEEFIDRLRKMVYGNSAAQAIAADDLFEQCTMAVPEAVGQPDPATMQQHTIKGAVSSGRGKGMDTNNIVKRQISDQQLPSLSSQTFHEPCSVHKRRTSSEEKALATYKNKQYMREVGESLIKPLVTMPHLKEEQQRALYKMLASQVQTYAEFQDHSIKGVGAMKAAIVKNYQLLLKNVDIERRTGTSAAQPIAPEDSIKQQPLAIPQAVCPPDPTKVQQQFKELASTSGCKNLTKLGKRGISETTAEHGTSGAQAIAAGDLVEQCHSAVSESVCRPNPTTMQQHLEISAVTLTGRGNEGTSRTSGDGLTMPELAGTCGAQAVAADDLVEQCPSGVSESVCQADPTTLQQHIEKGAVTSGRGNEGTLGGDLTFPGLAGTSVAQHMAPEDSIKQRPLAIPQAVFPPDPTTVQQQFKERASTSGNKSPKKLGKSGISESTAEQGDSATPNETNYSPLPPLTSVFIGREKDVEDIVTKLTRETYPVRAVVIVSIPGMGKTQVAIGVGHALLKGLESITTKKVIFVSQEEDLTELCAEIIRQISGRNPSESHDLVFIAKDKLRSVRSHTIIILDNTWELQKKQREEFDNFVEYVIENAANVQLIITTREDLGCKSLNIYKKQLEPLDCHSCALLIRRSVFISEENAQEISNLCGGIPLLLVHCLEMLRMSLKPEGLIQWLRYNSVPLLEKKVYDTLGMFLGNIRRPLLEIIVRVSVFPSAFSVEDISQILFEDDKLESETVKTTMLDCSLLQKMGNDKYALHPLVRQYCRAERNVLGMEDVGKSAQSKFNRHYIEKLKTLSKDFITKDKAMSAISSFKECKENTMDALWNCLGKKSSADEKSLAVDVTNSTEVLDFLAEVLSPPAKCLEFYEKCHDIARDSGDQRRLADSLSAQGFLHLCNVAHLTPHQQSLDKFKEAKRIRETLPEEQQSCQAHALTLCKLGLCYALQDEQREGLKLIESGINLRKKLGVPLYLAAGFCDLGNAYRKGGDHYKAIEIWEKKTLAVYQHILGDHPWTATIRTLIAGSDKAHWQAKELIALLKSAEWL